MKKFLDYQKRANILRDSWELLQQETAEREFITTEVAFLFNLSAIYMVAKTQGNR